MIVLTELDGKPTPKPNDKRRVVEGLQAVKLSAGKHSIKFQWIATAVGGFQFNVPFSLIDFNFRNSGDSLLN